MSLKSRLKRLVVQRLRSRGQLLIPEWRLPQLPLEEHLRALIARYDVDVVVDVGANFGQFHDTVRENLLLARPEATDDELWASLDKARLSALVRA